MPLRWSPGCCCDCPPPVVTCEIDGSGDYVWTVENATTAVIEAFNQGEGRPTHEPAETFPITLDGNGDASGTLVPESETNYKYCLVATNDCRTVTCCGDCPQLVCSLQAIVGDESVGEYEVIIRATIESSSNPPVYVNFDGDIYEYPDADGPLTFDKVYSIGCIPDPVCFTATNDCGNNAYCCYTPPCCWTVDTVAVELSNLIATYEQFCRYEIAPGSTGFQHSITIEGLNGLNGTTLKNLTSSGLRLAPQFSSQESTSCRCWQRNFILTDVRATITATNQFDVQAATAFDCGRTLTGSTSSFNTVIISGNLRLSCSAGFVHIDMVIDESYEEAEKLDSAWPDCVEHEGGCIGGFTPHPTLTDRCIREGYYVGDTAPVGISTGYASSTYACDDSDLDCDNPSMCERTAQVQAVIQATPGSGKGDAFGVVRLGICQLAQTFKNNDFAGTGVLTCGGVEQDFSDPINDPICRIGFYNSRITYLTCVPSDGSATPAELVLTTYEPAVSTTGNVTATPSTAPLVITTFLPDVIATSPITSTPDTTALVLATLPPTVTASNLQTVIPSPETLTITTFAPTVSIPNPISVIPETASLIITGQAPQAIYIATTSFEYGTTNFTTNTTAAWADLGVTMTDRERGTIETAGAVTPRTGTYMWISDTDNETILELTTNESMAIGDEFRFFAYSRPADSGSNQVVFNGVNITAIPVIAAWTEYILTVTTPGIQVIRFEPGEGSNSLALDDLSIIRY
jgi:hypothetical protein